MPFSQFIQNNLDGSFVVVKADQQPIISFILIPVHSVNFLQDRTYPGVFASGGTAGYG